MFEHKRSVRLGHINCRMVGPGGTDVDFFATPEGIRCVWTNESCPYERANVTVDDNEAASDGHNVSLIPWSDVLAWAALAPKTQSD